MIENVSVELATLILLVCFAAGGGLALFVAIADSDWFFRSVGVRALAGKLRRPVARIIYALIGLAILAMTWFMARSLLC